MALIHANMHGRDILEDGNGSILSTWTTISAKASTARWLVKISPPYFRPGQGRGWSDPFSKRDLMPCRFLWLKLWLRTGMKVGFVVGEAEKNSS